MEDNLAVLRRRDCANVKERVFVGTAQTPDSGSLVGSIRGSFVAITGVYMKGIKLHQAKNIATTTFC